VTHPLDALSPRPGASLIAAAGRGGAIGRAGDLPWHLPEDLAHFRRVTDGHAVVVGAVTWASIGRALPGRRLVVVSRRALEVPEGVEIVDDPDRALDAALAMDPSPVVAGGAQIYGALLDRVGRAYLTDVDVDVVDADAFLPPLDGGQWDEVVRWDGTDPRLTFRVLDRRS
jgi:dihydrofolate reductase